MLKPRFIALFAVYVSQAFGVMVFDSAVRRLYDAERIAVGFDNAVAFEVRRDVERFSDEVFFYLYTLGGERYTVTRSIPFCYSRDIMMRNYSLIRSFRKSNAALYEIDPFDVGNFETNVVES